MRKVDIYDTTLRDGAQSEDISFSVEDKLLITEKLDTLGVHYIEGGYPGANPKDTEFFKKARKLPLRNSRLVAFGSTHFPGHAPEQDKTLKSIIEAETGCGAVFGKTWDFHVKEALRVSLKENLDIIFNSVSFLKQRMDRVFFDAEHFFDGYARNPEYAIKCLQAAEEAGAYCLVLCDTNGGTLPEDMKKILKEVNKAIKTPFGIHAHNDSECAVANTLIAVSAGAVNVQGTINGLGERCGNANLCSVVPALMLKYGIKCISEEQLKGLRDVSRFVNEVANLRHFKRQPYVGDSAFAHKAGLHVSAVLKATETYEHVHPELVGNSRKVLVSDLAGKSNILRKAKEFGIDIDPKSPQLQDIVASLKDLENQGFQFEGAEASFELLMKKSLGLYRKFFDLIGFRVFISKRTEKDVPLHESTIMIKTPDNVIQHRAATGNGPVNALDKALREALSAYYPVIQEITLLDYKVRVLETKRGTAAKVRVLIESGDGRTKWGTVGVSTDVVEASYQALMDSIEYKLLKESPEVS